MLPFAVVSHDVISTAIYVAAAGTITGVERGPLFTAPEPPVSVYVADYRVTGNIGVRSPVCAIGRHLRVGGIVQRVTADAVRILVATPDIELMAKFMARVLHHCLPGSVERSEVRQSREAAHLALSSRSFSSHRSSFQHRSGNDVDDVSSHSGSSSSRELHGFLPPEAASGVPVDPRAL